MPMPSARSCGYSYRPAPDGRGVPSSAVRIARRLVWSTIVNGTGTVRASRASSIASQIAHAAALDFGATARNVTHCDRISCDSGIPTRSTACQHAIAVCSARGSALPMSSLAKIARRLQMKRGSSPDTSMRASQYTAASGSLPRIDLMSALARS